MCPLVVESSISSSPPLLAVNDRQSQSHQLNSTSSTGNHVPPSDKEPLNTYTQYMHIYIRLSDVSQPSEQTISQMLCAVNVESTLGH